MSDATSTGIETHRDRGDGDAYRRLQAAALLELYRRDVGHSPPSIEALRLWSSTASRSSLPSPIDPYAVLSDDDIARVMQGHD